MTSAVLLAALASAAAVSGGAVSLRLYNLCRGLERDLSRQTGSFRTTREALERRAREATEECERLQALTLSDARLSGEPAFSGRPSPRDAEELVRLVRGMTLVDDVVITAASGLALSRETTPRTASLAALGPALSKLFASLAAVGLPAHEVTLEMADATHVVARPLSGRGEGAILLVATTSQRASTLVLDAVAHAAARVGSPKRSPVVSSLWVSNDLQEAASRGIGSALGPALDRALREDHHALVVLEGETVCLSAARSGPEADARSKASIALAQLASRAAASLRSGCLQSEVTLSGKRLASWSMCSLETHHSVVTFGEANRGSRRALDRLVGLVRRALAARNDTALSGDAA